MSRLQQASTLDRVVPGQVAHVEIDEGCGIGTGETSVAEGAVVGDDGALLGVVTTTALLNSIAESQRSQAEEADISLV